MKEKKAILIFVDDPVIDDIIKKYHPGYKKFRPHLSLVYPFIINDDEELSNHIQRSISDLKRFSIQLSGLKKSKKDYYLYLLISKNKNKIISLHKILNSGILSGFKNPDLPVYIPHITLGVFKNKKEIDNAITELNSYNLNIELHVDKISLITLNKDDSIKRIKEFRLR